MGFVMARVRVKTRKQNGQDAHNRSSKKQQPSEEMASTQTFQEWRAKRASTIDHSGARDGEAAAMHTRKANDPEWRRRQPEHHRSAGNASLPPPRVMSAFGHRVGASMSLARATTAATSGHPADATEEQREANKEVTDRASRHPETKSDPEKSPSSQGKSGNISSAAENAVSAADEPLTWERFLHACAIESPDQIEPVTGATKHQRAADTSKIDRAVSRAMNEVQSIAGKLRKIEQPIFWRKAMIQVAHAYKFERPDFLCSAVNQLRS
jgi:hypothetical protein